MLVDRVRMTNLRSRRSLEVAFGPGLTILVGPNGVGKTTVLEAVALVLQGNPLRGGSTRDLISRGEEHLRVELDLRTQPGQATEYGPASERREALITAAAAYSREGERRLTADGAPLENSTMARSPARAFLRAGRPPPDPGQSSEKAGVSGHSRWPARTEQAPALRRGSRTAQHTPANLLGARTAQVRAWEAISPRPACSL